MSVTLGYFGEYTPGTGVYSSAQVTVSFPSSALGPAESFVTSFFGLEPDDDAFDVSTSTSIGGRAGFAVSGGYFGSVGRGVSKEDAKNLTPVSIDITGDLTVGVGPFGGTLSQSLISGGQTYAGGRNNRGIPSVPGGKLGAKGGFSGGPTVTVGTSYRGIENAVRGLVEAVKSHFSSNEEDNEKSEQDDAPAPTSDKE